MIKKGAILIFCLFLFVSCSTVQRIIDKTLNSSTTFDVMIFPFKNDEGKKDPIGEHIRRNVSRQISHAILNSEDYARKIRLLTPHAFSFKTSSAKKFLRSQLSGKALIDMDRILRNNKDYLPFRNLKDIIHGVRSLDFFIPLLLRWLTDDTPAPDYIISGVYYFDSKNNKLEIEPFAYDQFDQSILFGELLVFLVNCLLLIGQWDNEVLLQK